MDPLRPGDPSRIGAYELIGRLGAGGMGQVYLGRSPGGRQVAVKLILPQHAGSRRFRERFAREVQAARRVGGFHTAQVVDADPEADPPWMVTAYIPGPSLQDAIERNGPLPAGEARRLGAGIAEGLAAIHASGLVHRDLKPSNVILADDGPRIIDFGIARVDDASVMTATGVVLGTFAYMSPEQVAGDPVGPASDMFSLGCLLAFAASGKGPFAADSIPGIVHRITTGRADLSGLPDDQRLRDVIVSCLAPDPADRPSVATVLAGLVGTGAAPTVPLAVQPVEAVPLPTAPLASETTVVSPGKMGRRTFLAAGVVAAVAGGSGLVYLAIKEESKSSDSGPVGGPRPSTPKPSSSLSALPLIASLKGHTKQINSMVFSPDGDLLFSGSADHTVRFWDVRGERQAMSFLHGGVVVSVVLSPDGKTLASSSWDSTIGLWDVPGTRPLRKIRLASQGGELAFSPNGKTLSATRLVDFGTWGGQLFSVSTGQETGALQDPGGVRVVFSPDGKIVASNGKNTGVHLYNAQNLALLDTVSGRLGGEKSQSVEFSPDGRSLITIVDNTKVQLWDVASAELRSTFTGHTQNVNTLAFSPDGKVIATAGADKTIRLLDPAKLEELASLTGHENSVERLAFSPNGNLLASASRDKDSTVRLWQVPTGEPLSVLTAHTGDVRSVRFSPDGKTLATAGLDKVINLWKTP